MSSFELRSVEVVAGLIFDEGRVLVCQRNLQSSFALKWEFPGGKIEPGEDPESALRRELKEELGIEAGPLKEISRHEHYYPEIVKVNLRFFRVLEYSGEVKNCVFQQIKWVPLNDLVRLDFLEGDLLLIRKLASLEGV
jgi:8-oxo-dGTP diphosphatase